MFLIKSEITAQKISIILSFILPQAKKYYGKYLLRSSAYSRQRSDFNEDFYSKINLFFTFESKFCANYKIFQQM